jgi:hypothetical protein
VPESHTITLPKEGIRQWCPLPRRLRVPTQNPIASRLLQYLATQQPQATAKHRSSFAVSRQTSEESLPTVNCTREGNCARAECARLQGRPHQKRVNNESGYPYTFTKIMAQTGIAMNQTKIGKRIVVIGGSTPAHQETAFPEPIIPRPKVRRIVVIRNGQSVARRRGR